MAKNIAILDLNPFFGGGQKFLLMIEKYLSNKDNYYFLVKDRRTYDLLDNEKKLYIMEDSFFSQIKIINEFLSVHDIEIVIFNGNRPIYFLPFIKAKKKIAYKHTSNNAFRFHKKLLGHFVLNSCYLFCDQIVLLYDNAKKEVFWGKKKIRIINNGVELPEFLEKRTNSLIVNILCISRLDSNKGIDWLIKVFSETFENSENIRLTIAGAGPLYQSLDDFISNKGITNVKLLGFVDDIQSKLSDADIFVLPSKFESFPLSILEAMSFGLPIIATDTGGVREMIENDQNGYVINYKNDKELKESLLKLYNNKNNRIIQGEHSSKIFVEKFLISKCVEKIENLVYEI